MMRVLRSYTKISNILLSQGMNPQEVEILILYVERLSLDGTITWIMVTGAVIELQRLMRQYRIRRVWREGRM